jgi:hypothetical protein
VKIASDMTVNFTVILTAFVLVFLAELGDKTQLVAFSLTSTAKNPLIIFIATSLALSCSSVLAALLGGVASRVLPQFTSWAAVALFFGFGCYILFSKEAPPVKDFFLKTIAYETALLHAVPKIFKRAGKYDQRVMDVLSEESGHAQVFKTLLKEKRLFQDDINEDKRLESLTGRLVVPRRLLRKPFPEALEAVVIMEEAVRDTYAWFYEHLSQEHHAGDDLCGLLGALVTEETEHIAFFKQWREKWNA